MKSTYTFFRKIRQVFLWSLLIVLPLWAKSQITLNTSKPSTTEKITFVYDAGKGNKALFGLHEPLYFHTGVITSTSQGAGDWKFVVGDWGKADARVEMKSLGGDKYQFEFTPDKFYAYPEGTEVQQLAFVFRTQKGDKVGKTETEADFLIPVNGYQPPAKDTVTYAFEKREYLSHTLKNGRLQVFTNHGSYLFTPVTDKILHIEYLPEDKPLPKLSEAVVLEPQEVETQIVDVCDELSFMAGKKAFLSVQTTTESA